MVTTDALTAAPAAARLEARLQLTGEFSLAIGEPVNLAHSPQRVVAYLALARRPVARDRLSGALWADASQARADGNLRSALWRLRQAGAPIVERRHEALMITSQVAVDAIELRAMAQNILEDPGRASVAWIDWLCEADDLLPGWDEPWLTIERERLRQLRLHALERVAAHSLRVGEVGRAITLGLTALETEPYRESPYRLLVEAHLAEGNANEAARQYLAYRRLAAADLGVTPSARMEQLVEGIRPAVQEVAGARSGR